MAEITLGSIAPYATQIVWDAMTKPTDAYESRFNADGVEIVMTMLHGGDNEWYFAFLMPTAQQNAWSAGRTTSHAKSGATGQTRYLRIIRTVGEAVLDFCSTHAPEAVNVSGADSDPDKTAQKTRLYAAFIQDNASRISSIGYTMSRRGDELWLVRTQSADATGVENS